MPSRLLVNCLEVDVCKVYFEPWGSEYELQKGDSLTVRSDEQVEVSYVLGGIILGFTADDPQITNSQGQTVSI